MPIRFLKGEDNSRLKVLEVNGFCIPTWPYPTHEQEYLTLSNWKAMDNDILISAYPKSGTHWLWEVVCMLIQQEARRIDTIKEMNMIEGLQQAKFDRMPSPRVLNTHLYFHHLPKDFKNRQCKILFMLRNPKDVAVSFYNHHSKIIDYEFNGKWDPYLTRFLKGGVDYGSWFDHTLDWEKVIEDHPAYPIHTVYYENMKEDSKSEIRNLAKFLEVEVDENLVRDIDDLCSFDKMKGDKNKHEDPTGWKNKQPGMYRKGQVGDWKNWFTVGQNDMFDAYYKDRMTNSRLQIKFTV